MGCSNLYLARSPDYRDQLEAVDSGRSAGRDTPPSCTDGDMRMPELCCEMQARLTFVVEVRIQQ